MEWGQQMKEHQQNARDAMYQNSNYSFERRKRKTVIIDSTTFNASKTWSTKLIEPLIIDKLSDVFLESMITYNCNENGGSTSDNCAFLFEVNEFNINTNIASNLSGTTIANQHSFNKLLIPNENSNSGTGITTIHKAKKLNYICSINPCRLSQLTGSITNMNNGSIFNEETDLRMIVELVIIARD